MSINEMEKFLRKIKEKKRFLGEENFFGFASENLREIFEENSFACVLVSFLSLFIWKSLVHTPIATNFLSHRSFSQRRESELAKDEKNMKSNFSDLFALSNYTIEKSLLRARRVI